MRAYKVPDTAKLDRVVQEAITTAEKRALGYREQALKIYPWVCGRCGREFTRKNLRELTVHHRDHDHQNNPADGSNWELLCVYCHDNEHQRHLEAANRQSMEKTASSVASHSPFAGLRTMMNRRDKP
ncbi:YajD family HNH nuclease [uncultured Dechloromonas sp.]|uniref:YajD family HNH nuclease n=1 Tax=uncultured Dechloromonas sp. TaxID=171719 RepID=UPI0025EDCF12|nr:YajD family HNH nuclease [uncultured Dechloromonas sp.]